MTKQNLKQYAEQLADFLAARHGEFAKEDFVGIFIHNARRLSPVEHEDLGALTILEAETRVGLGEPLTMNQIATILDTVRHRLIRRFRRESRTSDIARMAIPAPRDLSTHGAILQFLESATIVDAYLFESVYLDGTSVKAVSASLSISTASIYRRLAAIRKRFRELLAR